jgi:hypothetical protein
LKKELDLFAKIERDLSFSFKNASRVTEEALTRKSWQLDKVLKEKKC